MSMNTLFGKLLVVASLSLAGLQVFASEVVWIDVRSEAEYEKGHLSQAVNIPHTEIAEGISTVTLEKDTEIKLYCGSGRRAGIALEALESMGYTHVSNEGGYKDLVVDK